MFPCLLVDDDGWVMPCADDDELQGLTEPDFIDDVVAAFDASARPLELHLVGEGQVIALRPTGIPGLTNSPHTYSSTSAAGPTGKFLQPRNRR